MTITTDGNFDFRAAAQRLINERMMPDKPKPMSILLGNGEHLLRCGLEEVVGTDYEWLPEYDRVVEWLQNNHNKGLALIGKCGRGKTVIARYILPVILNYYYGKVLSQFDAVELAKTPDKVIGKHILCVDDVGTEGEFNEFGNRRNGFAELCDAAEKKGKLLVMTSNLTNDELKQKYGERTIDRLKSLCEYIPFKGKSLRK